jgi:hypothetical protein
LHLPIANPALKLFKFISEGKYVFNRESPKRETGFVAYETDYKYGAFDEHVHKYFHLLSPSPFIACQTMYILQLQTFTYA